MEILQQATNLFLDWNENAIRYCSFKSNEHLDEGLKGETDLDILIEKEDYDKATQVLVRNRYIQVEPVDVGSYPNVVNWYGMDEQTGTLIHIHLHFEIMTGKPLYKDYCLPWGKLFLKDAYLDSRTHVYCADPNQEYVLLCTRLVVKRVRAPKKNNIPKDIIRELDYLRNLISEESLKKAVEEMYGTDQYFLQAMLDVKKLSGQDFTRYYRRVKKAMKPYQRIGESGAFVKSFINRTNRRISDRFNRKLGTALPVKKRIVDGGLSIAFVGIDGSGKSTVSGIITKWVSAEIDMKKYYAGAGDGKKDFISSLLLRGYKSVNKNNGPAATVSNNNGENEKPKKTGLKKTIKGIGSSVAYNRILKSNIKALKKSKNLTAEGLICIMDRYPQNSMPYVHDGAKVRKYDTGKGILHACSEKERHLLESIKDYPYDLLFRMIVPAEVSFARKPEESLESLKYKADTLKQVKFDVGRVVDVDATEPLEEVVLKVKREIWKELVSK